MKSAAGTVDVVSYVQVQPEEIMLSAQYYC